jgi:nitrite reductase/ring-hydroxylating ferredoxin subunit
MSLKFVPQELQEDDPYGNRPAWYVGLRTKQVGDYYGSVSSIAYGEFYGTMDGKSIVCRDKETGAFSVMRNVCAHAGARLLEKPGVQDHARLLCPVHKWSYKPTGELMTPVFEGCKNIRLHAEKFSEWNGYLLGYSSDDLLGLMGFGRQLGVPERAFSPSEFVFDEEVSDPVEYPRPLFKINYDDGYHVALSHQETFALVADESSYRWELSVAPESSATGYSIQEVRAKPIEEIRERLAVMMANGNEEERFGWGSFHLWLRKLCEEHSIKTPIDKEIFALWATIYGNGYLMPELYEGGLFLAVSYLVNVDPKNLETGNMNYVEFYVHKNVPEPLRREALRRFKFAYGQSGEEDKELCKRLWQGHQQGDLDFCRHYHAELEKGDLHWRTWFKAQFELR